MDTFVELQQAVCSDLSIPSTGSSLFPLDTVRRALNRAYYRAGGLFRWPETEDAQKRNSEANADYYDYPKYWRPDSMYRLEIDGELYGEDPDGSPLDFNDFRTWRLNDPNSTEKKWTTQWRRFFISPVITTVGSNNIQAWGQKAVAKLEFDSDTTIFSYHMRECNDAVVLEALEILKNKGEDHSVGKMSSDKAEKILAFSFQKIQQEKPKFEKNQPFMEVPDYFADRNTTPQTTGNFR